MHKEMSHFHKIDKQRDFALRLLKAKGTLSFPEHVQTNLYSALLDLKNNKTIKSRVIVGEGDEISFQFYYPHNSVKENKQ